MMNEFDFDEFDDQLSRLFLDFLSQFDSNYENLVVLLGTLVEVIRETQGDKTTVDALIASAHFIQGDGDLSTRPVVIH